MTSGGPESKFKELLALPSETEWVEFKEARHSFHFDDLGRYFCALCNEANLRKQSAGWLVFGVTDKPPRRIVGTGYCANRPELDSLKQRISEQTGGITFKEIHELATADGRVLMFEIPPAPKGVPTTWKGHFYGRNGESLGALCLQKIEQIRLQVTQEDWSAVVCARATIGDLEPEAVAFAREQYKRKHRHLSEAVDQWDVSTFLNKVKLSIDGRLTRAALVLLGTAESEVLLSPCVAHITWVLKDSGGSEKDYEHFRPPLILAVDRLFAKVRNLTYRYLPDESLFPTEVTQYDPWVVRETLHNCIAHQDYTLAGRINVVEESDSLLFTNTGAFLPGSVEEVIRRDAPPEVYRNRLLAESMVSLNMIDTIGSGIKRIFTTQRRRSFPMPDYDLTEKERVKVRILGKVMNERYTRILISRTDLELADVIALDKVQKGKNLTELEFRALKAKKLIEGRRPNLFVSAEIAVATGTKAEYIRNRALDKQHYKTLIESYLQNFDRARKSEIEDLLMDKLSDALDSDQKRNAIRNLLQEMRREGLIERVGAKRGTGSGWVLAKRRTEIEV